MDRAGLDQIDHRILEELTRNARISHAELAAKVLLSRNAVRQRIDRMERHGQIQGYTVVSGSPGQAPVAGYLMIYRNDRVRGSDVVVALQAIPEVVFCDVVSGDFDLIVRLEARSLERIQEIWERIAALPGVKDTVTAMSLSNYVSRGPASGSLL
ncbi:Lrp/AsnC family transcriptional regulator [Arthrobacter silvisoli]|uniref:Lrp/AsnC family transcriptional regulator n=1 Tax=Arthrobacter silvisoli TaxID=2291022 RepID=UPI000E218EB2|nr:Lrp/AsnC family transcriptional regulator [Arthrobacter silvisoli]